MFYGQQFRLRVDKHHLPKSSQLCQLKQRLLKRFLIRLCFESTFDQCWNARRECSCERAQFAGASGRLISCVFMTGPGFNFLRLTKSDCLWQSNLSIWHILASAEYEEQVMQQGNWQVLACSSEKRPYSKMCNILQKRIWSPFFMLDQRAYLVFKVSALLPLLHVLVDLLGIQKNESEFFIRCPNLEIFYYYPSFLLCKSEKSHGFKKEYCQPLHRDHYFTCKIIL